MFDREIDRTIDEVAREMTAGEPASGLRARVLARIDHFDDRHHARPVIVAVAAALIVAVIAGAAVVMILRTRITETTTTQATTSTATTTMAASSEKPAPREVPAPATRARRRPRAIDTTPSGVAALAPPPLDVESITISALAAPPSLEVEQLEPIAPIAVAPLAEGDRP